MEEETGARGTSGRGVDPNAERLRQLEVAEKTEQIQEVGSLVEQLSVRDRLMQRAKKRVVVVILQDDDGTDIPVEFRVMTSGERERAATIIQQLEASGAGFENYGSAINGFKEMLKELAITPGLDDVFWSAMIDADIIALMTQVLIKSVEVVEGIVGSFRQK